MEGKSVNQGGEFIVGQPESKEKPASVTYIDLLRHAPRFYGTIKVEIDGQTHQFNDGNELTPQGRKLAKDFGSRYPEEVTIVYPRGSVLRHGQTGEEILAGSNKFGFDFEGVGGGWLERDKAEPVVEGNEVRLPHRTRRFSEQERAISPDFLENIRKNIREKLQEIVDHLSVEEKQEFIKPEGKELRASCKEQAQLAAFEIAMNNEDTRLLAENEAYQLAEALKQSLTLNAPQGKAKAIPLVGSGMSIEALLKEALVVNGQGEGKEKVGFIDIEEIGGAMMPAEGFRIKALSQPKAISSADNLADILAQTDFEYEFTNPSRQELFAGKKLSLDWQKIRELVVSAQKRIEQQEDILSL